MRDAVTEQKQTEFHILNVVENTDVEMRQEVNHIKKKHSLCQPIDKLCAQQSQTLVKMIQLLYHYS